MDGTREIVHARLCEIPTFVDPPDRVQLALARSAGSRSARYHGQPADSHASPRIFGSNQIREERSVHWDVRGYFLFPIIDASVSRSAHYHRKHHSWESRHNACDELRERNSCAGCTGRAETVRNHCFNRVAGDQPNILQRLRNCCWQGGGMPLNARAILCPFKTPRTTPWLTP